MPAISFNRLTKGVSGTMTDQGVWEVRDVWQAVFDEEIQDPLLFLGDPLLPGLGYEHPENSLLRLYKVTGFQPPIDNALHAINFNLLWSTARVPPRFEREKFEDPDQYLASWSHRVITEPVEKAYVSDDEGVTFSAEKSPIQTILGEKMIPGIERNRYLPVCRYSRNELLVPFETLKFPGYVNSDEFTLDGLPVEIGQALISAAPVSPEKRFEEWTFRTVDYEIIINEDGWDDALLHKGFFCKAEYSPTFLDPGYSYEWRGKKRCMVENGNAEDAVKRPFVQSPEACVLNADGITLTQWTQAVDLEGYYSDAGKNWFPNGGIGKLEEDFVPHYRIFRHALRTSFAAWGFQ